MKTRCPKLARYVLCGWLAVLALGTGCDRPSAPPTPVPLGELPAALEKAFQSAAAEPRAVADQAVAAVRAQDYAKAFLSLQSLNGQPGLTKEQTLLVLRGTLALREQLQSAQAQGNTQAQEVLKYEHMNR